MGDIRISLSTTGVAEYRALAKKMREAGRKDLRSALRKQIAEAGKPVLEDVKAAVRSLHVTSSHGGGTAQRRNFAVSKAKTDRARASAAKRPSGLRNRIAAATKIQQTAKGIRIVTASSALPPDQASLPRHMDSAKGWRHPRFGDKKYWYDQKGGPWFASTIQKKAPEFRRAILAAIDETNKKLE